MDYELENCKTWLKYSNASNGNYSMYIIIYDLFGPYTKLSKGAYNYFNIELKRKYAKIPNKKLIKNIIISIIKNNDWISEVELQKNSKWYQYNQALNKIDGLKDLRHEYNY